MRPRSVEALVCRAIGRPQGNAEFELAAAGRTNGRDVRSLVGKSRRLNPARLSTGQVPCRASALTCRSLRAAYRSWTGRASEPPRVAAVLDDKTR